MEIANLLQPKLARVALNKQYLSYTTTVCNKRGSFNLINKVNINSPKRQKKSNYVT